MVISALTELGDLPSEKIPFSRLKELFNKQAGCPHCDGKRYYRYGQDKGSQRFKCKECLKTFTEYTGTWQERLHKKELVAEYILMMSEQKSLHKISAALHINKKTAFDWRHKILDTLNQDQGDCFSGIVESDETFSEDSEKRNRHLDRSGRKGSQHNHNLHILLIIKSLQLSNVLVFSIKTSLLPFELSSNLFPQMR